MQILVLLLFLGIPCLLLTSFGRSFLKSALRFAKAQLVRNINLVSSPRKNQKRRKQLHLSAVVEASPMPRKDQIKKAPFLTRLTSRLSRSIKQRTKFVAIFAIAIIAGHSMSSQLSAPAIAQVVSGPSQPMGSLKTREVPGPSSTELDKYITSRQAAIVLGKSLFWDMQVGSDGIQSCATCHFNAGADSRIKNQISPGLLRVNQDQSPNGDPTFQIGGKPNYTVQVGDYPFHKLRDPNDRESAVVKDANDVTSSQGVFNTKFIDVIPGNPKDQVSFLPDDTFNVRGTEVRRVEPRNTPTMINAVFNFRNFWDGRAQNDFNGVNPFGKRDDKAFVLKSTDPSQQPIFERVRLENSSLASQAVGPPLSSFEMSADGRTFQEVGQKFGAVDPRSSSVSKGRRLPRETGKKLFSLRPLGKQLVAFDDSVLGRFSRAREGQKGITTATYETLVQSAFQPAWWQSNYIVVINPDGSRTFTPKPNRALETNEYTLGEYNFSLFFGLAIQLYESTLVSDNAPIDQYFDGNSSALSAQQKSGKELFEGKAKCINCHGGPEFTNASVKNVQNERLERMVMGDNKTAVYDNGFYNIGVRPTFEDLGVGGLDPFGKPLSMSRLGQRSGETPEKVHCAEDLPTFDPSNPDACAPLDPNERVAVDGAFKTSGLRNVELTAPYFHNGGQRTLAEVVQFYNRGGDRRKVGLSGEEFNDTTGFPPEKSNLDPDIERLGLSDTEQVDLVAFLKSLTDQRVKFRRAPFDGPELFIPNGHPGSQNSVTPDANGIATDQLLRIPAVGRNGGTPLKDFLASTSS